MRIAPTSDDQVGEVLVRASGDAPATWAIGSLFERLASAAETDGGLDVSLVTQPPGVATPLHVHTRGRGILSSRRNHELPSGQHALSAKRWLLHLSAEGRAHAFRVTGTSPVRFLGLIVPGGLMDCTTRSACRLPSAGYPDSTGRRLTSRYGGGTT